MSQPDLTALFAELDGYATLGPNWDGYDAEPPAPGAIADAKALLRDIAEAAGGAWIEPSLSPSPCGEVCINWRWDDCGGRWTMILIGPGNLLTCVTQTEHGAPHLTRPTRRGAISWALWVMEGLATNREETGISAPNAIP